MHVLITGGCGFIGSHLVDFHLKKGDVVQVVDDLSTGNLKNVHEFQQNSNFQLHKANILTWDNLEKAVAWADRIYHMAAVVGVYRVLNEPMNVFPVNINGCQRLFSIISAAHHRPRVIIASSSSVYGHSHNASLKETDDLILKAIKNPLRNYALSKIVDEALSLIYYHTQDFPVTIIRLFNTIGPRQTGYYGMVVPRFVQQACQGEPITVYGDGKQTRSFCDVRDAISFIHLLAEKTDTIGEIINVGNDREIPIHDLALLVKKLAKSDSEIQYVPLNEAYGEGFSDIVQRRPDLTKLHQLTDFKHQWTLEQTITDLITRFRQTVSRSVDEKSN